jgi:hypothetical protein
MFKGRLSKQTKSLWNRLSGFITRVRGTNAVPPDPDRDAALKKMQKLNGSSVEAWVTTHPACDRQSSGRNIGGPTPLNSTAPLSSILNELKRW